MNEDRRQAYPYWMVFLTGVVLACAVIALAPNKGQSAFNIDDGIALAPLDKFEFLVLVGGIAMAFYGLGAWIHAPRLTSDEAFALHRRVLYRFFIFMGICGVALGFSVYIPLLPGVYMVGLAMTSFNPGLVYPTAVLLSTMTIVIVVYAAMALASRRNQQLA